MRRNQRGLNVLHPLLKLLVQTLTELRHQCRASRYDHCAVERPTKVNVALLDARRHHLMHSWVLQAYQLWVEQNFRGFPFFSAKPDSLAVGQDKVALLNLNADRLLRDEAIFFLDAGCEIVCLLLLLSAEVFLP
jgi:hypothetical protein